MQNAKLIKCVIIVMAVSCSLYQIYDLTTHFFGGEVLTELQVVIPDRVKFPAFTVSFPITSLLSYTKLEKTYPSLVADLNKIREVNETSFDAVLRAMSDEKWSNLLTNNLTIKQIFEVSYKFGDIFSIDAIPSPENAHAIRNQTIINKLCNVTGYVRKGKVFFTILCFSPETRFSFSDLYHYCLTGTLIRLQVNQTLFRRTLFVEFSMHQHGTLVRGSHIMGAPLASEKKPHMYPLSYKRTEANLLPAPYETNCRDYKKEGFESRSEKREECENKLALKKFGYKLRANIRWLHEYLYLDETKNISNLESEIHAIRAQCKREAMELDCYRELYVPVAFPLLHTHLNSSIIIVKISREPEIIKTCEIKTPLTQYVTLICSVLAFWFGFSVTGGLIVALSAATNENLVKEIHKQPVAFIKRRSNKDSTVLREKEEL